MSFGIMKQDHCSQASTFQTFNKKYVLDPKANYQTVVLDNKL